MPDVIPVTIPKVDVANILSTVMSESGRNLSRSADLKRLETGSVSYLLEVLATMTGSKQSGLEHISFGFLILAPLPSLLEVCQIFSMPFCFDSKSQIGLLTGTLRQWRDDLTSVGCHRILEKDTQIIFSKLFLYFEQLGLRNLWENYRKAGNGEGLFSLEPIN